MKIKKMISVLSASALMTTALTAAAWGGESAQAEYAMPGVVPEEDSPEPGEEVSLSMEVFPCYLEDMEYSLDLPVYFLDDVTDLPYVNLADWADVMVSVYSLYGEDDYELELETDGPVALYTRESGYAMLFDFNEGTIAFDDYDNFVHDPQFTSLLDMVSMDLYNEEGEPLVLERIERGSFDRYGREIELNLTDYNIPIVWSEEDDLYLVPLQTMADFLLAGPTLLNSYFNGEAVYLATKDDFGVESTEFTPLGVSYYSAPYGEMSETLAWFNYCELCLALDHLYGLKEIHDITTFDNIFYETGYREDLRSTDPNIADGALYDFIYYYLDDLHSGFTFASYRTEELYTIGGTGLSSQQDSINEQIFSQARENTDREITAYQEIGNTAYITFDGFQILNDPEEYYESGVSPMENVDPLSPDTIELILYAHERITRQDSPIENVVIDMSLNGGGALDACAFVAAWFLGEASTSIRSSLTGGGFNR